MYLTAYGFLSFQGQYEPDTVGADNQGFGPCLCIAGFMVWEPKYVIFSKYGNKVSTNALGKAFYPLVWLDQAIWHPGKEIKSRMMTDEELKKIVDRLVREKQIKSP